MGKSKTIHKIPADLFLFAAIIILNLLIYSNSFKVPFQFDDLNFVEGNETLKQLSDIKSIWSQVGYKSRVVAFFTFSLNYYFHKLDLFGYHAVNLFIHVLNSCLVFLLVKLFFSSPQLKPDLTSEQDKSLLAFFIALCFAAHPIQTQAVTYISQRFASLATLFYLTSLYFYLKARLAGPAKFKNFVFYALAIIAAALGFLTKEITFTLPCMIFIAELFFVAKEERLPEGKVILRRLAVGVILILCLLIIPALFDFNLNTTLLPNYESGSHQGDIINVYNYPLTQFRVIVTYLKLLVFPVNQNLDNDFTVSKTFFEPATFFSFVLLLGIFMLGIKFISSEPLIAFGIFWFFLALAVESSLIPIRHVIFEHRAYLPSVGFFIASVYGLYRLVKQRKVFIVLLTVIVSVFSVLTFQRNKVWAGTLSLWQDVAYKSPKKSRSHLNLGDAYFQHGDYYSAIKSFNKALDLDPQSYMAFSGRGLAYQTIGRFGPALADFNKALIINPGFAEGYCNRGYLYWIIRNYNSSLADLNKAIELNPVFSNAYNNRGILFKTLKKYSLALEDLNKAVELKYNNPSAYYNRGNLYREMGLFDKATDDYSAALKYNPGYFKALNNRGSAYFQAGKLDLALRDYSATIKMSPNFPNAYYNRAMVSLQKNDVKTAYQDLLTARMLGFPVDEKVLNELKSRLKN